MSNSFYFHNTARHVLSIYRDNTFDIECCLRRFKRKPKIWSIEEVHELWMRTNKRESKQRRELSKVRDKIISEIQPETKYRGQDCYIVYFEQNGRLRSYDIAWHSDWNSYGSSIGDVQLKTRDEKLTFILAKQRAFELGEEYHKAYKLLSNKSWRVLGIMWQMVEEQLRKHFKEANEIPPKAFLVTIGGKKYHVATDEQHRSIGYSVFHFKGEYKPGDVIEIR